MYGKIERKEINQFLDTPDFKETAKVYFDKHQPHIWQTGYYSAPSWNWAYQVGITSIKREGQDAKDFGEIQYFEVVTKFGEVRAARKIYLPAYN